MVRQERENSYYLLSIRNRILAFAVLVTVVPSLAMGLLLQNMLQSTLEEKVEQKFTDSSQIIEREISLWLKERVYDLNVFSNSSIVTNVVAGYLEILGSDEVDEELRVTNVRTIETYLTSLQNQFDDYVRIFVLSRYGEVLAASETGGRDLPFPFPEDAVAQISDKQWFKSEVYTGAHKRGPLILIGVPLFLDQLYEYESLLVIEVQLTGLMPLLEPSRLGEVGKSGMYESLVEMKSGEQFLFSSGARLVLNGVDLSFARGELALKEFRNQNEERLMGLLIPFRDLGWGLFIAEDYEKTYAGVIHSRYRNILIVCSFGVLMGIAAYLLTRQIMIPLSDLTKGASKVAEGDLDVHLKVHRNDEIGFATAVFNEMVAELKRNQTKLEQLATTDPLTGLSNRKRIMTILNEHYEYYKRYKAEFSVLMLDVDHFKSINDTYGHQVGDMVLKQVAMIFRENLRNVDAAGRYGGEEFFVILAESAEDEAVQAAERIRKAVAEHLFTCEDQVIRLKISIGIGRINERDEDDQAVIKRADMALYRAKREGRNRVVYQTLDDEGQKGSDKVVNFQPSVKK